MSNQVNAKAGLSVKDLVTTGIFTALLFVFIMVGGVFFATNPVLTFFMPAGSALLAGPIYLLMIAKVHKRWSVTIMGVIMAIIWFVTGMHWAFALGYLIMAVVADFVAGTKQYKSKKINSLSYILFSLGGTGSYLVFFADPQGWAQTMLGNGTEQSYIDTMQTTANAGIFIAMFVALLVTASISAFVGCKMLNQAQDKQDARHLSKSEFEMVPSGSDCVRRPVEDAYKSFVVYSTVPPVPFTGLASFPIPRQSHCPYPH